MTRVALITGANQGIGLQIVKSLVAKAGDKLQIILTARSEEKGKAAVAEVASPHGNVEYHQLDTLDAASIERVRQYVAEKYGGIDLLCLNAGVMCKGDYNELVGGGVFFDVENTPNTIETNYTATGKVFDALRPLFRPHARIVIVGSQAGSLSCGTEALQKRLQAADLKRTDLDAMMAEFVQLAKEGGAEAVKGAGWPASSYRASKMGVGQLSRILARDELAQPTAPDVAINVVHPGWVKTSMGGENAMKTPEEGAATPVWLLLQDPTPEGEKTMTGLFFSDKKEIPY